MTNSSAAQVIGNGDATAKQLTCIWQDLLGVESISADDNYFDLGGDSSLAVHMFARVEKLFHVKLPLATLYDAPTIAELACILRCEAPVAGWSPLVAIQSAGSRPPFFCMHPHGGNVLIYRDLSNYLGSDQPFYGLQCQGLDGAQPPLTRIEEMAALYVREIHKVQPHGPYFLGGYCMGGTIAFEVAQQLQAEGESTGLLALFDSVEWSQITLPSFWDKSYYNIQRVMFHTTNFSSLDPTAKAKFIRDKANSLRGRIPVWGSTLFAKFSKDSRPSMSESRVLGQIWRANFCACANYIPQPYLGSVTDFRPTTQYRMLSMPGMKWDRLALRGHEIVVLPVNPPAMLVDPFVKHLADALRKSIDTAIGRYETSSTRQMVARIS